MTPTPPDATEPERASAATVADTHRRRRPLRALMWLLGSLLAALGLSAGLLVWALANLHHPRLKPQVVAAALEHGGVVLDYEVLRVSLWSGRVEARGIALAQPDAFARVAPEWLRVDTLDAEVDTRAIVEGHTHVRALRLGGVELHVVRDAQTNTFGLLFPGDPDASEAPTPLSRSLGLLRGLGVEVDALEIELAQAEVIEAEGAAVISRASLSDLALRGHLHEARGALDLALTLRSPGTARTTLALSQTASDARGPDGLPLRAALDLSSELAVDVGVEVREGVEVALALEAWPAAAWLDSARVPLRAAATLTLAFAESEGRTRVTLDVPAALGGVLEGHIDGVIEDATPTTLRSASGRVDARFDELPFVVPGVSAAGFRAALALGDATLGPEGIAGQVDLEATLAQAAVEGLDPRGHVRDARLTLHTRADDAGLEGYELALDAGSFAYESGAEETTLGAGGEALELRLSGPTLRRAWFAAASSGDGEPGGGPPDTAAAPDVLTLTLARLELRAGTEDVLTLQAPVARAQGPALLRAALEGLPLEGDVHLEAAELDARRGRERVSVTPLRASLAMHALELEGGGLFGLGGAADVALEGDARASVSGQSVSARGLAPRLHVDLDAGTLQGDVAVAALTTRERGETTLDARRVALSLRARDPLSLAPPRVRGELSVSGRVGHVAAGDTSASLPRVSVDLVGRGGAYALRGSGEVSELRSGRDEIPGTHALALEGGADLRAHVYDLRASLRPSARRGGADASSDPGLDVAIHAALAADGRTLEHRLEASAANLARLVAPYLPEGAALHFDDVSLSGAGALVDALSTPARAGHPLSLRADLGTVLAGNPHAELTLRNVRYALGTLSVSAESALLGLDATQDDGGARVRLTARAPRAHVVEGRREADIADVDLRASATLADVGDPTRAQVTLELATGRIAQTFARGYPMSDVRVRAALETTPSSITLASLHIENPLGRSRIELSGAYEGELGAADATSDELANGAIYGREALTLMGTLEQDLAGFSGVSTTRRAAGTLRVPVRVESGDLTTYRVSARVQARDVSFIDVASGVAVEGLVGEIPITEVVTLLRDGYLIQASGSANPLGRARFPDVQPFLERDAFVSARRVILADQVLGPLAGNMRVEGTTFAIDRLQVGFRGGVLTGQLEADLRPGAAYLTMRGSATGVRGREAEDILDANFALRFAPASLALDGSVQLVRMSRSHLEALLDMLDPYREDTDMNTIRGLLRFGYPRFVRARAEDGLLDLELQLGGIAGLASVQAIRAIPIAPLLDDYVAPIVDPLFRARDEEGEAEREAGAAGETDDPSVGASDED